MGQKTRDQIITEGLQYAGNTSLTTLAQSWLNEWLRGIYAEGDWGFLRRDISGVVLAAGSASLTVGSGQGGITPEIKSIVDPIGVYNTGYSAYGKARIAQLDNNFSGQDERMMNTATWRGTPAEFRVRMTAGTYGQWKLYPRPVPDQAFLLAFDYYELPVDLSSNVAPLYPNDETMVFAVASRAMLYQHGAHSPQYGAMAEDVGSRVTRDKSKYMSATGTNDSLQLDGGVFR